MGLGYRAFLAGGLGFAAAFVVACGGSSGLLSGDQASSLSAHLDAVSSAISSHDCGAAANAVNSLNDAVSHLPSTVNTTLLKNLGQGADTVAQLASRDCPPTPSPTTSSSSSATTTPTTTTTTTTPTTTTTTPTTTTTTTTPTTTTTTPTTTTTTPTSPSPPNPPAPVTSTSSNGGAGLGGGGTGTSGSGGAGK